MSALRLSQFAFVVAVGAAIFALPVEAKQPEKFPVAQINDYVLTDVCSFPIYIHSLVNFTEFAFPTRIHQHVDEQDTFTANGKTLVGVPFTFNIDILFDSSGNFTHGYVDGVFERVPLPDGGLFLSAGRVDYAAHPGATFILSPDKGNPGDVAGLCAALSP